jgi:hypothetical protein
MASPISMIGLRADHPAAQHAKSLGARAKFAWGEKFEATLINVAGASWLSQSGMGPLIYHS